MIINGKQYRDLDKEQLEYEISQRMRRQFIARYEGGCSREVMNFVLSLSSARWDDCKKDIKRGKITPHQASNILSIAVSFKVVHSRYAELLKERWGIEGEL